MAQKIVNLHETTSNSDRQKAATAVIEQMLGYFDAMESRLYIEDTLPTAA